MSIIIRVQAIRRESEKGEIGRAFRAWKKASLGEDLVSKWLALSSSQSTWVSLPWMP